MLLALLKRQSASRLLSLRGPGLGKRLRPVKAKVTIDHRSSVVADETEKRWPADLRLPDRREDAAALVIGRARGDLLSRSDDHLVAARDGLPLRGRRVSELGPAGRDHHDSPEMLEIRAERGLRSGGRNARRRTKAEPHG